MKIWTDAELAAEIEAAGFPISGYLIVGGLICYSLRGNTFAELNDDERHNAAKVLYLKRLGVPEVEELPLPAPLFDPSGLLLDEPEQ